MKRKGNFSVNRRQPDFFDASASFRSLFWTKFKMGQVKTASTSKPKFTFTKLKKKENRLHSSATPPPLVVLREKKVHILMSGWIPYILKQNLHLKKGYKCKKNTANYVKTAVFH